MSQPAAFQCTYSDWRLIKTRKVVQIVFEVPVERAGLAYEVLGGMPRTDSEVWCAVARLEQQKEVMPNSKLEPAGPDKATPRPSPATGGAHSRGWHEMKPSQQAGLMCKEQPFINFLIANHKDIFNICPGPANHFERAAYVVRSLLNVSSRADIDKIDTAQTKWRNIISDYRAWMREPQVV